MEPYKENFIDWVVCGQNLKQINLKELEKNKKIVNKIMPKNQFNNYHSSERLELNKRNKTIRQMQFD